MEVASQRMRQGSQLGPAWSTIETITTYFISVCAKHWMIYRETDFLVGFSWLLTIIPKVSAKVQLCSSPKEQYSVVTL